MQVLDVNIRTLDLLLRCNYFHQFMFSYSLFGFRLKCDKLDCNLIESGIRLARD